MLSYDKIHDFVRCFYSRLPERLAQVPRLNSRLSPFPDARNRTTRRVKKHQDALWGSMLVSRPDAS